MSESAIVRTPVEIGIYILQLVIKTRLHCYDNASIVYDLDLFVLGCKSGQQFIESERNRTNLRLVCRSWNSALQDVGDRLVMVELATNDWPPKDVYSTARRIEFLRQSNTPCCCTKLPCSLAGCLLQYPTSSRVRPDEFLNEEYSHVEALLTHHIMWFGQKLPQHAPRLRLLSWSLLGQHHGTNCSTLHNLTHLLLSHICHTTLKTIEGEIFLPQVAMLRLHFAVEVSGHFDPITTLTAWRFPKLKRLMLGGACREELWSDIVGLITACRVTSWD
jgi:hypothetical protein